MFAESLVVCISGLFIHKPSYSLLAISYPVSVKWHEWKSTNIRASLFAYSIHIFFYLHWVTCTVFFICKVVCFQNPAFFHSLVGIIRICVSYHSTYKYTSTTTNNLHLGKHKWYSQILLVIRQYSHVCISPPAIT